MDEQVLKAWAAEAGFAECALCSTENFETERRMVEAQPKLKERAQLRFDPQSDTPCAKSLAVLLWPYAPAALPEDGCVFIDSYYDASNAAYHAAKQLEERLIGAGVYAKANVSYPAKRAAVRAGLGLIGKSSLLITPKYGTRVVIILMATDIPIETVSHPEELAASCAACGRCIKACPSGALTEGGMEHPECCMRNYMMEGIVVPDDLRSKMDMRLIGCDICQRVCLMQPEMKADVQQGMRLDAFLSTEGAGFSAAAADLAARIGRNAARPQRIRAQAAILAGNSLNASYLPVLSEWSLSDFPAVREHAKWASAKIEAAMKSESGT